MLKPKSKRTIPTFSRTLWGICFVTLTNVLFAQPANDDCVNAIQIIYAQSEAEAILVDGDTRNATASTTPLDLCSTIFYTDDVWFKFTTPVDLPEKSIHIKAYFNNAIHPTDLPYIGMAIYEGCASDQTLITCFTDEDPELTTSVLSPKCILANHEYLIRIWSGGSDAKTEGTFRIAVFQETNEAPYFWWETFDGGLDANGWTTEGYCAIVDSNANAGWKYLPGGLVDQGAYMFQGAGINSISLCDGAVGIDSDYNDNGGIENNFGGGPCPSPGFHTLLSPVIYCGDWIAAGLSTSWIQAIRQYQSEYKFAYRSRNADEPWTDWKERKINENHLINGDFIENEEMQLPLPAANLYDSLQIRFTYLDNYYVWAIDDIKIIPQECTNSVISDFFAIPPFASLPIDQLYPFPALADLYNIGACPTTNTILYCTIVGESSQDTIYFDSLQYETEEPNSIMDRRILPTLIDLPFQNATYRMTYRLTQDSVDFDPGNNEISFSFTTGGNTFALEDGYTRSVTLNHGLYDTGAPPSYAYGNYFKAITTRKVLWIEWGVNKPDDMVGQTVQIYLLQWTDTNKNNIAEPTERNFVGFADYTFDGNEGENVIIQSPLENFESPGESVLMHEGLGYIAIVEYQADSSDDPTFYMLASEERDYTAQQIAMDSAITKGLTTEPIYFSVLGFSVKGNIANIDYEVKELDPNDNRIFIGNYIVPVVRIVCSHLDTTISVKTLPLSHKIIAYPNPAHDLLQVNLDFPEVIQNVTLNLINASGVILQSRTLPFIISNQVEIFDVSALPGGTYHLQIQTPEGNRSIPFVVLH